MGGAFRDGPGRWFPVSPDSSVLSCGSRDQNRAAVSALMDCIGQGLAIHARQDDGPVIAAAQTAGAVLLCQSSGSTGRARTIRRAQASWIASFEVNRRRLAAKCRDCYAVLGHLGHSLTLYGATEALHLGANLLVLGGDAPRTQMEVLRAGDASILYATPAQLRLLCRVGGAPLPAMRQVLCGGGSLASEERDEFSAIFPNAMISEFYGASETSFITITDMNTPAGSVGRPYPGVELRLVDAGEIWVRSPYLFDGYEGEANADTAWSDGYLTVGEIGWQDENGNLFLRGRKSRMVTVADVNVFLEDIERCMAKICGAGRFGAAIPVPDPLRGHAVIGVVEGTDDPELAEALLSHCRNALGPLSTPRRIEFLDRLPMLPSGKPDLQALQKLMSGG